MEFKFEVKLKDDAGKMYTEVIKKRGLEGSGKVQQLIDYSVLKELAAYVPLDTGQLKRDAIINTVIGSGSIRYLSPYARKQYYIPMRHEGQRCAYWFEQMKAEGGKEKLLRIAKKAAGAK